MCPPLRSVLLSGEKIKHGVGVVLSTLLEES